MNVLDRLKSEPALVSEGVKAVVVVLVSAGVLDLSADQQSAVLVIAVAVFGLITAITTRPFQVAALSEFIQTVGVAIAAFGWDLPPDVLAAVIVVVGTVVTLMQREQVTPNEKVPGVQKPVVTH